MIPNCQTEPINELKRLAQSNRQSVLVEGPPGCGKTYLTQQYANTLNIDDFSIIQPKVADIREALDGCLSISNKVMLCIENLDLGQPASAYTLLKSLEEPLPHVYIVITCRNAKQVPDTIISRSAVINVGPPNDIDIDSYGKSKDAIKFANLCTRLVWHCVRSFSEADAAFNMSIDEIAYY